MRELIVAIDIGATKILSAILNQEGKVLARCKEPTRTYQDIRGLVEGLGKNSCQLINEAGACTANILGIAVGAPGPLDYIRGNMVDSPNLPWKTSSSFSFREELSKRLGNKVLLDNDANMAAWGELYYGSGQGCHNFIYMTVSTGIGGGIIIDGNLYRGRDGGAGEFGHMVITAGGPGCSCGRRGCIEALASGTALAREARELIEQGRGQGILSQLPNEGTVSAIEVAAAARQGDPEAKALIDRTVEYLGLAIANLVNLFNPERLVLGGGVGIGMQDLLLEPLRSLVKSQVFSLHAHNLIIEASKLGEDNVLLGCLAAILRHNNRFK